MLDPVKQSVLYPYKYMSDFEKFKEELPSREKFYSLTGKKITDKEYELVLEVCDKFEIKTMKVYHDLYITWDVLLLSNVFEKFRNSSLKDYGLYQSHYLFETSLSCDKTWARTYFRCWHVFILWKMYESLSFLHF